MNREKITIRVASFFIAFILVLSAVAGPIRVKAAGTVALTVSNATATAGADVTISINISANSGLAAGQLLLQYDASKLEYKTYALGTASSGGMSSVNPNYNTQGNFKTIFDAFIHIAGATSGGSLLNVTFKVKTGWTGSTPLTLTAAEFANTNYNAIAKTIMNGSVTTASGAFVAITDSLGEEVGAIFPVKLGLFGLYRNESLKLGFETGLAGATVKWTSSNPTIVTVDENTGIITNHSIFARAADITVTLTKGSTQVYDTVRIVFYKFPWQLDYFSKR